jgi:iron complex transport system permease protein
MIPHTVRLVSGASNRTVLPLSALSGALLVVLCDTAGRVAASPEEIPAGVVTALLGPVFFLWLLFNKRGDV